MRSFFYAVKLRAVALNHIKSVCASILGRGLINFHGDTFTAHATVKPCTSFFLSLESYAMKSDRGYII